MFGLIASSSFSVFGIPTNPALFAFLLAFALFGGLNYLDFKRFD